MGIPYSREIHAAFDQVTPLVAAGFQVLKTTKDIAILIAVIQILVGIVVVLLLLAILGVIYSVNPDLERERQALVTPFMKWLASWLIQYGTTINWSMKLFLVLATASLGLFVRKGSLSGMIVPESPPDESAEEDSDS